MQAIAKVLGREPLRIWNRFLEVNTQPRKETCAIDFGADILFADILAEIPIELNQRRIDSNRRFDLCCTVATFEVSNSSGVGLLHAVLVAFHYGRSFSFFSLLISVSLQTQSTLRQRKMCVSYHISAWPCESKTTALTFAMSPFRTGRCESLCGLGRGRAFRRRYDR